MESFVTNEIEEEDRLFTKEELIERFGWDTSSCTYSILSLMLLVSLLIGVYFAWTGQDSNANYLLGDKNMSVLPMAMSLMAT